MSQAITYSKVRQDSLIGHRNAPTESLPSVSRSIYQVAARYLQLPLVVTKFASIIDRRCVDMPDLAVPPGRVSVDVWQVCYFRKRDERSPDGGSGEPGRVVRIHTISDRLSFVLAKATHCDSRKD